MTGPRTPIEGVVYHPEAEVARYRALGVLRDETLGEALHQVALEHAERTALITPDARLSYRELDGLSDRAAAAFLHLGLKPRDRVLFQLGNVTEFMIALHACFKAGIIPVCTLPAHREQEIGFLAGFTQARALIVQADWGQTPEREGELVPFGAKMQDAHPVIEHLIVARGAAPKGARSLAQMIEAEDASQARAAIEALDLDSFEVGIFQLSGGTTGIPKVIPRCHSEYLYNCRCWLEKSGFDASDIGFWPLPAIHNAAFIITNMPMHLCGGAVILQQDASPEAYLGTIERERVTCGGAVLPIVVRCIDSGRIPDFDLSSVRDFITLGESKLVARSFGVPAHHVFGMAEGLIMRTLPQDPEEIRMGGVGRPVSEHDEVRLVAPGTETPAKPGEMGEMICRGPYTIRGYFKAEEHNAGAFTADGFYRSGDLMELRVIDGTGYFAFAGREKDNIDRGVEKISAEEIERAVIGHPAIREVAVIGMPDRTYGERVCAFVIPEAGARVPDTGSLGAYLKEYGLAKFKWPERIEVVENFPVTKVGKTSKGLLREMIEATLAKEDKGREAS
jgi:2,3-dihydroxybenzoate-AMP ligase